MRRAVVVVLALLAPWVAVNPAHALSCVAPGYPGADADRAQVIVTAVALPGPSLPDGTLLSPASWQVERYEKGAGPDVIQTPTSSTLLPGGAVQIVGPDLMPAAGQRWRLLGALDGAYLRASICLGAAPVVGERSPVLGAGRGTVKAVRADYDGGAQAGVLPLLRVRAGVKPRVAAGRGGDVSARLVTRSRTTGVRRRAIGDGRFELGVGPRAVAADGAVLVLATMRAQYAVRIAPAR